MPRLGFEKTRRTLEDYGIPYVETVLADSRKQALKGGREIGFPLVLKTASPKIVHRTEKRGLVKEIESEKELEEAWMRVSKLGKKVLVQPFLEGTEVVIGMERNEQFGPVVMFGLGGIFVEVLEDVSFRVAPVFEREARRQIREIKGFKLLTGFRGREPVDLDKLGEVIRKLSRLSLHREGITEVDLNPVIADNKRVRVVDAKMFYES